MLHRTSTPRALGRDRRSAPTSSVLTPSELTPSVLASFEPAQPGRTRPTRGALSLCLLGALALVGTACQNARPGAPGAPGGPSGRPLVEDPLVERGIDVRHYDLTLEVLPLDRRVEGIARLRLASTVPSLGEVRLDLRGLEVWRVEDPSGRLVAFEREEDQLVVDLPITLGMDEETELAIHYGGRPVDGLWFAGGDATPQGAARGNGPNQVWTQGQPDHSSGWFPCFDHPADRATSELTVTVPDHWITMAPGELIDERLEGGMRTDHWRMDLAHPAYLMSLVAGEFLLREDEWEGIPLYTLAEARYASWMDASFAETKDILSYLSDLTGIRYPYPKYSQACVADFPWGGMENVSATTLTPLTLDDEAGNRDATSHGLVAHELVHQWFGNLLTCETWEELWLNEGFATYLTETYFEETRGLDEFRARMRDVQDQAIATNLGTNGKPERRPIVHASEDLESLFSTHAYEGAAARLHLLRFLLGDEAFWQGLRVYLSEHQGLPVTTADFQDTMERVSGRDLDRFFTDWFYGVGEPEIEFRWDWKPDRRIVECTVRQMQQGLDGTPETFAFPVEIEIRNARGTAAHRVEVTRRRQVFTLPADPSDGDIEYVRFDVHGWVPKLERSKKDAAEWLAIAHLDDDVNGRRDAMKALGAAARDARIGNNLSAAEIYTAELGDRLQRDSSRFVRRAAAAALAVAGGVEAHERLERAAAGDPDAGVRVAALKALQAWGASPELAEFAAAQFGGGYSWATMGAAAGLYVTADPDGAYAWITEKLFVDSPHDQLAGYLLEHLGNLPNEGVAEQLMRWTRDDSLSPTARAVAVKALAKQSRGRARAAEAIAGTLGSSSFRLRNAAIDALRSMNEVAAKRALQTYYPRAVTGGERRAIEAALQR